MRRASKKNPIILPVQERSKQTFGAILAGATHVLSHSDWPSFTTNTIAQVAGVSVASIYQYFHDKDAILKKIITDLIARDHLALLTFAESLSAGEGSLDELVAYGISLYGYQPLLRQKITKFNLAMADETLITSVTADYEKMVLRFLERDFAHIEDKPIAAALVVQAVMWNCNGFLAKDPHFYQKPAITKGIVRLARGYVS